MVTHSKKDRPDCFGKLNVVFPKGHNGLRHTPETCLPCDLKTSCLRSAINASGGIVIKEEMLDRAYKSGRMGFWRRWSGKKELHRKKTMKKP